MPHTPEAGLGVPGSLREAVADARAAAREQLEVAWQLHVDRVQEQLTARWREQIELVIDERFSELGRQIEGKFQNTVRARLAEVLARERGTAQTGLYERLNQAARRLRQSEDREQWVSALLDASAAFCRRVALFTVEGPFIRLERVLGFAEQETGLEILLTTAPAFASAAESLDPVVAMNTAGELSEPIAAMCGASANGRVCLLPLGSRGRAVAVLCAAGGQEEAEMNALELLTTVASSVWESKFAVEEKPETHLVSIAGTKEPPAVTVPAWSSLSKEQQELHLRAQRYARVQVAELRLYQSQAVREGRSERNLYARLKEEIDAARVMFQREFLAKSPSMADYLHVELVSTLAHDDTALLGPEYPGPLR